MEPCIILLMQEMSTVESIDFVDQLCECDETGRLKVFSSRSLASMYQEDNAIDGKIVELPIY